MMNVMQTKTMTEALKRIARLRERIFGPDSKNDRILGVRRNSINQSQRAKMSDNQVIIEFKTLIASLSHIRAEITRERYNSLLHGISSGLVPTS